MLEKEILHFIKQFETAKDCFLHGCCYWFAVILKYRFSRQESCTIMSHVVDNHFATLIGGKLYDVSGEISRDGFMAWSEVPDYDCLEYKRIVRDCVLMEDR